MFSLFFLKIEAFTSFPILINKRNINKWDNKVSFNDGRLTFNVYLGRLAGVIPIEK